MNDLYTTYRPDGFHTLNTYIFSEDPEGLIDFLKASFAAQELNRMLRPDTGEVANVILKIGDSCLMISQANGPFLAMKAATYLFTSDVDALYQKALDHGAKSVFTPADMPYGDRQGGVEDPYGNYWWISKRLVSENYRD